MTDATTTPARTPTRHPDHRIDPLFPERWSPRAFADDEIPEETLLQILEAARWAPSANNLQPWRFAWARRGTPAFERFLSVLAPGNQAWARRAAALLCVGSTRTAVPPGKTEPAPLRSHSFDAGAAWASLALQAQLLGWGTHAMGGFDAGRAREALAAPDDLELEIFVAVGRRGDPATLPDWAREREHPNARRPLAELVRQGGFR